MNRQQFSEFIKNPDLTNTQSLKMLEDFVKRYPYCQSGQILFTYNLYKENDLQYHTQLKKAAVYSGDRKKLKTLLNQIPSSPISTGEVSLTFPSAVASGPNEIVAESLPQAIIPEPVAINEPSPVTNECLSEIPVEIQLTHLTPSPGARITREDLLMIVRERLLEIEAGDVSEKEKGKVNVPKNVLIEKFILEEPRISPPKVTFFNPTDTSLRSNVDDEEIISETLARLYANQGNIQKAIHIYQKLSLLNQEKSRYFAAQIENLKS